MLQLQLAKRKISNEVCNSDAERAHKSKLIAIGISSRSS